MSDGDNKTIKKVKREIKICKNCKSDLSVTETEDIMIIVLVLLLLRPSIPLSEAEYMTIIYLLETKRVPINS